MESFVIKEQTHTLACLLRNTRNAENGILDDHQSETSMRKFEFVATHAGYHGGNGSLFFSLLTPSTARPNVGVDVAGDIHAI
jgi:hypothetical protein